MPHPLPDVERAFRARLALSCRTFAYVSNRCASSAPSNVSVLTAGLCRSRRQGGCAMKHFQRHHLWSIGVVALALLSFFTGTSLACFQQAAGSAVMAESCCKGHCQHVMIGEAATECCQQHQVSPVQSIPASASAKVLFFPTFTFLPSAILPPTPTGSEWYSSPARRPPLSPPLYTLYCAFLI